jgi:dihydrofolate synthase / folylpolyglutamate synthase
VIFTRYSDNPRSVPLAELLELAKRVSPLSLREGPGVRATMEIAATPAEAWAAAGRMATPDDLICITGSFFLASEMRAHIAARRGAYADIRQ